MSSDLLFERAARFGPRTAVIDATGTHSYAALRARTDAVAAGLLERGVRPGDRVAYLIDPGFDHVAVQWGIWRAGAIAVPLATSHPERELAHVLDDATPSVVVASEGEYSDRVAGLAQQRGVPLSTPGSLQPDSSPLLPTVGAQDAALVIYTSGTTGRPKGVVSTHANLRAQITTLVTAWEWRETDRSLHVLPLHHIHGLINALGSALWCGATVEFLAPFDALRAWER
ncbi:MAG: AMP-binding protein, partial [Gemmatimonadales bacterium]